MLYPLSYEGEGLANQAERFTARSTASLRDVSPRASQPYKGCGRTSRCSTPQLERSRSRNLE